MFHIKKVRNEETKIRKGLELDFLSVNSNYLDRIMNKFINKLIYGIA